MIVCIYYTRELKKTHISLYNLDMTGDEKIQTLLKLIDKEYRNLIRGNIVEISSSDLERAGISLKEQVVGLNVIAEDYGCIKYTASKDYDNEDDLSPYDLRDIVEIASLSHFTDAEIKQQFLEMVTYKIVILEKFNHLISTLNNNATVDTTPDKNVAEIHLNKSTRTIRISYNGISRNLKTFRSSKSINYIFISNLLDYPGQPLGRDLLHINKNSTMVKDLPKTAGFSGELKNIFFDIDTKKQTLTLYKKKSLTPEEAEIVNAFVKQK